jgi:hypothetical protein
MLKIIRRIKKGLWDSFCRGASKTAGFTLFEVILAIFILVVAIVPIINAFGPSLFAAISEEATVVFTNYARQTLNRVAALDFKTINTLVLNGQANPVNLNTLFPDGREAFSLRGVNYIPTVTIADASAGISGLLEITVTIDRITLKTLKADF